MSGPMDLKNRGPDAPCALTTWALSTSDSQPAANLVTRALLADGKREAKKASADNFRVDLEIQAGHLLVENKVVSA